MHLEVGLFGVKLTGNALRADVAHRKRGSIALPRVADYSLSAGLNRHVVGGESPLQERK